MPPRGSIVASDLGPLLAGGGGTPLEVKFEVFCRALKPVLSLSRNGLQRAFGLLEPHNHQRGTRSLPPPPPLGYAPVQRPHVTSIWLLEREYIG